jgi:hypothetical protein
MTYIKPSGLNAEVLGQIRGDVYYEVIGQTPDGKLKFKTRLPPGHYIVVKLEENTKKRAFGPYPSSNLLSARDILTKTGYVFEKYLRVG